MKIEIDKKYRVIDETKFMPEHNIKNGDEFTVSCIDEDGDLYSLDIEWDGKKGNDAFAPNVGWALLMNGRQYSNEEMADYTGTLKEVE